MFIKFRATLSTLIFMSTTKSESWNYKKISSRIVTFVCLSAASMFWFEYCTYQQLHEVVLCKQQLDFYNVSRNFRLLKVWNSSPKSKFIVMETDSVGVDEMDGSGGVMVPITETSSEDVVTLDAQRIFLLMRKEYRWSKCSNTVLLGKGKILYGSGYKDSNMSSVYVCYLISTWNTIIFLINFLKHVDYLGTLELTGTSPTSTLRSASATSRAWRSSPGPRTTLTLSVLNLVNLCLETGTGTRVTSTHTESPPPPWSPSSLNNTGQNQQKYLNQF